MFYGKQGSRAGWNGHVVLLRSPLWEISFLLGVTSPRHQGWGHSGENLALGDFGCWRGRFVSPEHQASRALHKNHIGRHLLPGPFLSLLWGCQAEPKIAKKRKALECFPRHPFCLIEAEIPCPHIQRNMKFLLRTPQRGSYRLSFK